jgi:hypothetical protein
MSAGKQSKNEREREAFNQRAAQVGARCARSNFISRGELPPELDDIVLRIAGQVGLDHSAARGLVNLAIRHNVKNFLANGVVPVTCGEFQRLPIQRWCSTLGSSTKMVHQNGAPKWCVYFVSGLRCRPRGVHG